MGLRSIHFGKNEEQLRNDIKNETDKFYTIIVGLAKKYGQNCVTSTEKGTEYAKTRAKEEAFKVLHTVFKNGFVRDIIFNLDTTPAKVITLEELKPYRCNYPTEMTLRTKNLHGNGSAPCKRRLGKTNVFFCSQAEHLAYAKKLKLPVYLDDVRKMNVELPPRPTKPLEIKHIRKKSKRKLKSKESEGEADDEEDFEETWEFVRKRVKQNKEPEESKELSVRSGETEIQSSKLSEEQGTEVPRFQCSFVSPLDGSQCCSDGTEVDFYNPTFLYCQRHVTVDDELLDATENALPDSNMLEDLRALQLYDSDIIAHISNGGNLSEMINQCRERLHLSRKYGFGTPAVIKDHLHQIEDQL